MSTSLPSASSAAFRTADTTPACCGAKALLRSGSLQMLYQPVLDLRTGQVLKVEALARLRNGEHVMSPAEFLPQFEAEDLLELYILGLDQALSERRDWLDSGMPMDLAINISPGALDDPRYFDATLKALARHDCEPRILTLEILESEVLGRSDATLTHFQRYQALGVSMAEDDLGCGHSSLVRLRQLPFNCIKIDRNIVSMDAADDVDALHFVYQLTRLGHALGKTVIVEGVDSLELIDAIGILGADAAQGYAIARPMPGGQLPDWVTQRAAVPLPAMLDTALGRIARLVVAEERLHAGGQGLPANEDQSANTSRASAQCCSTRTCPACKLAAFRDEVQSIFDGEFGIGPELDALLQSAARYGVRSEGYRLARRQLASAIR